MEEKISKALSGVRSRICVFAGSSFGQSDSFREAAKGFGQLIARRGLGVVYGGARVGLMGAVADAALAEGGEVIGVLPKKLVDLELAHDGLSELHVVDSMHDRKALMAELADAFVALPGGIGTLEETFEVLTWTQLGFHAKPVGLLNVGNFFDRLLDFLDHLSVTRFLKPEHRGLLLDDHDPNRLLSRIMEAEVPHIPKWID